MTTSRESTLHISPWPWKYYEKRNSEVVFAHNGLHQAAIALGLGHKQATANARLIAAAPELLDALKCLLEHAETMDGISDDMAKAVEVSRATIAKAIGDE